jgi:hypothetical protein
LIALDLEIDQLLYLALDSSANDMNRREVAYLRREILDWDSFPDRRRG